MKNTKKYIITIIVFVVVMLLILLFFIFRYNYIHLLNKSRELLEYLYTLDIGEYKYKSGAIYTETEILSTDYYFEGNGNIKVDDYKNVSFIIQSGDYCVSKTQLGEIKIEKKECHDFVTIEAQVNKNNNIISFIVNEKNLEYLISNSNDLNGKWVKPEYTDNIIIKSFDEDKHYIWFKDKDGNLSKSYSYSVECFFANKGEYDKNKYYCDGSIVSIDDINYIVLDDNMKDITIMKQNSLDVKLSHCLDNVSDYCYYTTDGVSNYKWSKSYINYYLNNIYIKTLNDNIQSKLKEIPICDDFITSGCLNDEGCGGFTKNEINFNNWSCNNYSKSKIRILSYNEYVNIFEKIKNKTVLIGNYWLINSGVDNRGSSVQFNYNVYIKEEYTTKLDIKPVFTISKY